MTRTGSSIHSARALATSALLVLSAPALAQNTTPTSGGEIVVEAPRSAPIQPTGERDPYTGAQVITTTVRITARYGDLDLTKPADAERLRSRVEHVAQAACRQLDKLQPFSPDPACVGMAVAKARPAVDAAIAAASR